MSQSERRAVLEAIVHARDPRVTPSDRLRALEMLHELGDEELDHETFVRGQVSRMTDEAVLAHLDSFLAAEFTASGFASELYPELGAVLRAEMERRVRELADPDRIERDINERAERRARELYESRSFALVNSDGHNKGINSRS